MDYKKVKQFIAQLWGCCGIHRYRRVDYFWNLRVNLFVDCHFMNSSKDTLTNTRIHTHTHTLIAGKGHPLASLWFEMTFAFLR